MISQKAKDFTQILYATYGSSSGYLFGITPDKRVAVEAVVQATIDMIKEKEETNGQAANKRAS